MERTSGIVLRKRKLTESSLIICWLTESHGRVDSVAKGALKPGSKFAGILDLFYLCEVDIIESRRSDLHTLADAMLLDPLAGLRRSLVITRTASYFTALIEMSTELAQPVPEVFELLLKALRYLDSAGASAKLIQRFEARLCLVLGIASDGRRSLHAHQVLGRHLGRLPADRQDLLDELKGRGLD